MTPSPRIPSPRTPGAYAVALVCLGNICRSPMADVVLQQHLAAAGLASDPAGRVAVASAGTGGWHVGSPMDDRAAATLRDAGYDPSRHRARRSDRDWLAEQDLVLAMDESNLADLAELIDESDRSRLMLYRDVDPDAEPGSVVPDPYYGDGDGFTDVLAMVERTSTALVAAIRAELATSEPSTGR